MIPFELVEILADAPFLPRGRGALILIAGGIIILLASVLWSLMASQARRGVDATPDRPLKEPDDPVTSEQTFVEGPMAYLVAKAEGDGTKSMPTDAARGEQAQIDERLREEAFP